MTKEEAYKLWLGTDKGCVWDVKDVPSAFAAGWDAHEESLKQTNLFGEQLVNKAAANPLPTADDIYAAYPLRVGKQDAVRAIVKALKTLGLRDKRVSYFGAKESDIAKDYLLARTQAYAKATESWPAEDKKFIPHPATWFNRGSYDDDPATWHRGTPPPASQFGRSH